LKKFKSIEKAKRLILSNAGIARAVVIVIIVAVVLLGVASIPLAIHFRDKSREMGCMAAMDTANKELRIAYLMSGGNMTKKEAKEAVTKAMNGWDDLCPGGGTMHIREDHESDLPFKLVCGIHGDDAAERTRLNALYVYEKLCERIPLERLVDNDFPEKITVSLNGEDLDVVLVKETQFLPRGTKLIQGREKDGTVAYYGLVETFEIPTVPEEDSGAVSADPAPKASDTNAPVCYFAFADENFSAIWTPDTGWTGSSHS